MKKIFFAIVILLLSIGLCSCGQAEISNTRSNLSKEEERFVGTWTTALLEDNYYQSVRFMGNGKAIFTMYHKTSSFEDQHCYSAGEWFMEDERIVLFIMSENGGSMAYTFDVEGDTLRGTINGKWPLTFSKSD